MNNIIAALNLMLIGIAMLYPALFILIDKSVKNNIVPRRFLQVNYIIHLAAGLTCVLFYWLYDINYPLQLSITVYLVATIIVVLFYWNSELTKWNLFTASILFGFIVFYRSITEIVEITPLWPGIFTGLLSAGVFSILIHLVISTVHRSTKRNVEYWLVERLANYLYLFLGIRVMWDILILTNLSVATQYGDVISTLKFFWQVDPNKLILFVLFGMIIPIVYYIVFRKRIISPKSKYRTLFVSILLLSVCASEFLAKYFLLQFGIVL